MKARELAMVTVLLSGGLQVGCGPHSLSRSEEGIRQNILKDAPVGTSKDRLRDELSASARIEEGRVSGAVGDYPSKDPVGSSYLRAHLGDYGIFLKTDVMAIYYFDEQEKLLDVRVIKYRDGI